MVDPTHAFHRHAFVKKLARALREKCGVEPGQRLLLAVSGGADSTALLIGLASLARQEHWSLDVHAAHINHHLRTEADRDELFVLDLCRKLDLPCHVEHLQLNDRVGNLEDSARKGRYASLLRIARTTEADAIVAAHHADDQLETILMRLIRGASPRGLGGMAWKRRIRGAPQRLIRPMLGLDHAAAVAFLNDIGQPWCEDHTNLDTRRVRARLRAEVLPVLRSLRPAAAIKASQGAERLREAELLLLRLARTRATQWLKKSPAGYEIDRNRARRWPADLLYRVVRIACLRLGAGADALGTRVLEPIVRGIRDTGGQIRTFDLAGGVRVEVRGEIVRIQRYDPEDEAGAQR